jgi:hypothetical protein
MTISMLIHELKKMKKEYGEVSVRIHAPTGGLLFLDRVQKERIYEYDFCILEAAEK